MQIIYLDNKMLTLWRPSQVKIVETLNDTLLEVVGPWLEVEVSPEQLVNEFSGLKKVRDVEAFAYKYGGLDYGEEQEDVRFWLACANLVRKLLELRKAFLKNKSLLEIIGVNDTHYILLDGNIQLRTQFRGFNENVWTGETPITVSSTDDEVLDEFHLKQRLPLLIKNEIIPMLDVRISFNEAELINEVQWDADSDSFGVGYDEKNTRFVLKERKYAPALLPAIFYSLWGIVNNGRDIQECEECGGPTIVRRQREHIYCGGACKKKAERKRRANG